MLQVRKLEQTLLGNETTGLNPDEAAAHKPCLLFNPKSRLVERRDGEILDPDRDRPAAGRDLAHALADNNLKLVRVEHGRAQKGKLVTQRKEQGARITAVQWHPAVAADEIAWPALFSPREPSHKRGLARAGLTREKEETTAAINDVFLNHIGKPRPLYETRIVD